ncbi:MAG: 6-phosphogluconolactonase [Polyangiaceae bacterium]|jgi:6-phosphogluconolactonase
MIAIAPATVLTEEHPLDVARVAADRISETVRRAIAANETASLALSGGTTPRDTYERLATAQRVDWFKVSLFWVDERAVAPTDARSNFLMARSALIDRVGLDWKRIWRMPADSPDIDGAALEYARLLRSQVAADDDGVPALDVAVLGLGADGHTASLFPGESTVELRNALVASVVARGVREARLTVTAPVLEHARNVFVLVVGKEKRAAVARVFSADGSDSSTPGRVLRRCRGSVTWILDKEAAGGDG